MADYSHEPVVTTEPDFDQYQLVLINSVTGWEGGYTPDLRTNRLNIVRMIIPYTFLYQHTFCDKTTTIIHVTRSSGQLCLRICRFQMNRLLDDAMRSIPCSSIRDSQPTLSVK